MASKTLALDIVLTRGYVIGDATMTFYEWKKVCKVRMVNRHFRDAIKKWWEMPRDILCSSVNPGRFLSFNTRVESMLLHKWFDHAEDEPVLCLASQTGNACVPIVPRHLCICLSPVRSDESACVIRTHVKGILPVAVHGHPYFLDDKFEFWVPKRKDNAWRIHTRLLHLLPTVVDDLPKRRKVLQLLKWANARYSTLFEVLKDVILENKDDGTLAIDLSTFVGNGNISRWVEDLNHLAELPQTSPKLVLDTAKRMLKSKKARKVFPADISAFRDRCPDVFALLDMENQEHLTTEHAVNIADFPSDVRKRIAIDAFGKCTIADIETQEIKHRLKVFKPN